MARSGFYGLGLATFGALVLTPDAMLMRLSGMEAVQMLGWRSSLMALVMLGAWAVTSRAKAADLRVTFGLGGIAIALCQAVNGTLFTFGIVGSPVTPVLLGVATVPVLSAILARLISGERTSRATWATIVAVLIGIAIAIFGKSGGVGFDASSLRGALFGLGVALCLALSFVLIRRFAEVPIPLAVGLGAGLAGTIGLVLTGSAQSLDGITVWPIVLTSAVVLPLSFYCLSLASRHTAAANVSLLLLLETVLGPLWVWLAIGEAPTPLMLVGGAIVIGSLALYLLWQRRRAY
ncbi:EamA family transporter [Rhodobacterales bacterium HKCCE4037]|nr:EamA family transporter [Rhodobacterales bacterium HKCCE4037]